MVDSNTNPDTDKGPIKSLLVNPAEQMRMLDLLSPEVRRLVAEAPIQLEVGGVLEAEKNYGTTFVLKRMAQVFDELFPGWARANGAAKRDAKASRGAIRRIRW